MTCLMILYSYERPVNFCMCMRVRLCSKISHISTLQPFSRQHTPCTMGTHHTHTRAASTLLVTWITLLLLSPAVGESVRVTTLAEVVGNDGTEVTVPCSFTVTPEPTGDQDYVLRWIKYPEGGTFYNVYNYNGQGEFDGPVNKPAEGRYRRVNQDLVIPNFDLADQGNLCCEIVLLPDMTATDSNCTQVRYIDFDASTAWKAVDKKNTSLITNHIYYIRDIPPVTLEVNISYNEIYPPCDLSLYRRTTEGGTNVHTLLDKKLKSQVTAVNGRYSLLMEAKQPVECDGEDVITLLMARLENCLIQYHYQYFIVICSDVRDVNECESSPCGDGGTCIDLINGYRCIDGMSTISDPKAIEIDSINPLQGVQAGGTQLTLLGKNFPPQVNVYIGENPVVNEMACRNTMCFVHSPAVNTSVINTPLSIAVQIDGKSKIDTGFKFTYKANPSIRNIHPLETLIDGGTTITVTGESLATVGDSTLQVITVHTILNTAKNTTASFESPCVTSSDIEMKCVTPKLTVPDQFIRTQTDSQRKKRAEQEQGDLIFEIENERLDVYLGFKLDGDATYGNVSESLPELGRFAVFVLQPECEPFDGVHRLEPESSLSVRGKRLDRGLRASDYRISVGDNEVCHVVDLTSNSIVCELPALSHNVEYGITVHPGVNLDGQFIGHIEIFTNTLYYIIGGSIAGVFLIIITTPIIICVLVRRHKEQMVETRAHEAFDTDIVDSVRHDPAEALRHGIPQQGVV